jgi:hypothetical protein
MVVKRGVRRGGALFEKTHEFFCRGIKQIFRSKVQWLIPTCCIVVRPEQKAVAAGQQRKQQDEMGKN